MRQIVIFTLPISYYSATGYLGVDQMQHYVFLFLISFNFCCRCGTDVGWKDQRRAHWERLCLFNLSESDTREWAHSRLKEREREEREQEWERASASTRICEKLRLPVESEKSQKMRETIDDICMDDIMTSRQNTQHKHTHTYAQHWI